MSMYKFYLDGTLLPVTPARISFKGKNMNKQVVLINEGEVNILKTPGLEVISFDCSIPAIWHSHVQEMVDQEVFMEKIRAMKREKKIFQFILTRIDRGKITWDTNITCSLEDWELVESWEEGRDLTLKLSLRESRSGGNRRAFYGGTTLSALRRPRDRSCMGGRCGSGFT